jgi:hypothetical protein
MKILLVLAGISLAVVATSGQVVYAKDKTKQTRKARAATAPSIKKMIKNAGATKHPAAPMMNSMFDQLNGKTAAGTTITGAPIPEPVACADTADTDALPATGQPGAVTTYSGAPQPGSEGLVPCEMADDDEDDTVTVTTSGPSSDPNVLVWKRSSPSDKAQVKQRGKGNRITVIQSD